MRIVLIKSDRTAKNAWPSLLVGQFDVGALEFDSMEKKMTLERFQREVCIDLRGCMVPFLWLSLLIIMMSAVWWHVRCL